jgi:hypothetical protein
MWKIKPQLWVEKFSVENKKKLNKYRQLHNNNKHL